MLGGLALLILIAAIPPSPAAEPENGKLPPDVLFRIGKFRFHPAGGLLGVRGLALSPDGKTLASADAHKSLWLWRVPSGEELMPPRKCPSDLLCVAFSPDGRAVAANAW